MVVRICVDVQFILNSMFIFVYRRQTAFEIALFMIGYRTEQIWNLEYLELEDYKPYAALLDLRCLLCPRRSKVRSI